MATNEPKDLGRKSAASKGNSSHEEGESERNSTFKPHKTVSEPALTSNYTLKNIRIELLDTAKSQSVRRGLSPRPNIRHADNISLRALKPVHQSSEVKTQTAKTCKRSLHQESTRNSGLEPRSSYSDTEVGENRRKHLSTEGLSPGRRVSPRVSRSKSQCGLIGCSEMETRSRSRLSRSTPRSRTSARTRPIIKQELDDDSVRTSMQWDDSGIIDSPQKDTPTHLFGLDGSREHPSSGLDGSHDEHASSEDEICVGSDANNNVTKRRKGWCLFSPWCVLSFLSIMVVLVAVAHVFQPCPRDSLVFDGMNINIEGDRDEQMDTNLRELQEKLEQLTVQVSGLRQTVIKNETVEPTDPEPDTPMTKEKLQRMLEKIMRDNMEAALDKYSADKLGIPDYALESDGGSIHVPHHSPTFNAGPTRGFFGMSLWQDSVSPKIIIQPDNKPGQCWAFQGEKGFVVIKLSKPVIPTMFTLEHIPSSLSTNGHGRIPSAPKDFSIWGWSDEDGTDKVSLGNFRYDNEGKSLQTFKVKGPGTTVYSYVELRVESNHGQPTHTCIYRIRVHGDLPPVKQAPPKDCPDERAEP